MDSANKTANGTKFDSSWYTCSYSGYNKGRSTCWELETCKPMTSLLQVLSVFGFVSNIAVFILICAVRRLQKPMYTGIRMLTIPDALFLLNRFLLHSFRKMPAKLKMVIIYGFSASFYSSIFHVILLSVQQYLMIAYPLECISWISNKRVFTASAIIWICAITINIPYFYIVFIQSNSDLKPTVNAIYTVSLLGGPILVLGILHILKIKALKRSLVNNSDKAIKRVSQIISIVVGVYVLTTTPINARDVVEAFFCPMIDTWYIVLGHIGRTLLLVNHSINPYIYFISTPQFRRTVSNCLGYKGKRRGGSRSQGQSDTNRTLTTSWRVSANSEPTSVVCRSSSSDPPISTHL